MIARLNFSKIFVYFCIILAFSSATLLFFSSYLPYEMVKAKLDSFTVDGDASTFTPRVHQAIVVKVRWMGVVLFLTGGVLLLFRQKLLQFLEIFSKSFQVLKTDTHHTLKKTFLQENKLHLAALGILMGIALVIRIAHLNFPMRYDEAFTFYIYASKPFYFFLSNYSWPNNHIFHTLLVHMVTQILGNEPWIIRLPAFFAGILIVPMTYVWGRRFYDKHSALLATALVASASWLIEYSANARGYSLICLLTLLLFVLGDYLLRNENLAGWTLWVGAAALGCYTVPVMLFPLAIFGFWFMLSIIVSSPLEKSPQIRYLLFSGILTVSLVVLLYLPVIVVSGPGVFLSNPNVPSGTFRETIQIFPYFFAEVWGLANRDLPEIFVGFLLLGFLLASFLQFKLSRFRIPMVLAALLGIAAVVLVRPNLGYSRIWQFLLPLYLITAAAGISRIFNYLPLIRQKRAEGFALLSVGLGFFLSIQVWQKESIYNVDEGTFREAEPVTLYLKEFLQPTDKVIASSERGAPLIYYFQYHGLSRDHFNWEGKFPRLFVVAYQKETLPHALGPLNTPDVLAQTPKMLKQFKEATVYQIDF